MSPARGDKPGLLLPLPGKVASWSRQDHGQLAGLGTEPGGRQPQTQNIGSSAFLKAINSHLSCRIDLLCEIAVSVIFFFKPYDWDLALNLRQDVQELICSVF